MEALFFQDRDKGMHKKSVGNNCAVLVLCHQHINEKSSTEKCLLPSLLLLPEDEIPTVRTVKDIDITLVQRVKPVVIEIIHARPLQLYIQKPLIVSLLPDFPHRHLVSYCVTVTGIPLDDSLSESRLALALMIGVRRVEIIESPIHEDIDHLLEMVDVYRFRVARIHKREPHESESEFLHYLKFFASAETTAKVTSAAEVATLAETSTSAGTALTTGTTRATSFRAPVPELLPGLELLFC